jgi:hypothetical protein
LICCPGKRSFLLSKRKPRGSYFRASRSLSHRLVSVSLETVSQARVSVAREDRLLHRSPNNIYLVATGSAFSNVLKAKEDLQKSAEQLEQEKRAIILQRVPALRLDGQNKSDLIENVRSSVIVCIRRLLR